MSLSAPPKINSIEAFPIRLPRDLKQATGTAGTPTALGAAVGGYHWSAVYPTLYSSYIETALVKVTLDNGMHGWGEAQAPLAPRVACTIVADLLAPALQDEPFDGERKTIEALWLRMFQTMRVRGQTGGFMMDAISGIDLALWDLAGKLRDQPVARLLAGGGAKNRVPCYLSGVSGRDEEERADFARQHFDRGLGAVKIFHDAGDHELLSQIDTLRNALGDSAKIAVDALWRFDLARDQALLNELEARGLFWLECPFNPDELEPHRLLRQRHDIPLAVGESYRSRQELEPFFTGRLIRFVQPDLGRAGLTETLRIGQSAAAHGVELVPHVSIALGPQIAAAIHAAAVVPNCSICEYNPNVFGPSNRYLVDPLAMEDAAYTVPDAPGLGIDIRLAELLEDALPFQEVSFR
jgi:D-galactarolactone cycloisomerase